MQGGIADSDGAQEPHSLTPVLLDNGLFEVIVDSPVREVRLLRLAGADRVWVNEQAVAAPINPVVLEAGKNRIWGAPREGALPQLELSTAPGPICFDVAGAHPTTWLPEKKHGEQNLLVINASEQVVPQLTLVGGGVGPFERKRVPVWRGMPPLSVMRVSVPLQAKKRYDFRSGKKEYPLFLSAGGLPGVDPLVQSLMIPRRKPFWPSPEQRTSPEVAAPVYAQVEQWRLRAKHDSYLPEAESGSSAGNGASQWRRTSDSTFLVSLNTDARLIQLRIPSKYGLSQLRIGSPGMYQDFQFDAHPIFGPDRRFWAEWDGRQWQYHRHGVPAVHKGLHRSGPLTRALSKAIWVYGTAGTESENREILNLLRAHAGAWLAKDRSHLVEYVSDEEYLKREGRQAVLAGNVVVVGNADTNRAWADLAAVDMPVQFRRGSLLVGGSPASGGRRLEGDGLCGVVLQPHPRNADALVVFIGDSGPQGARAAIGLRLEQMHDVDFALVGAGISKLPAKMRRGVFDHRWRFPGQADLAETE